MLSYSQFAFVAALITTVLACIAYVWAMSAGHRSTSRAPQKKVLVSTYGDDLIDDLDSLPEVADTQAGAGATMSAATSQTTCRRASPARA